MIEGDRVLAVIAGRGGSKGLPRKNIRELAGKPLIAWSIEAAAGSAFLDRTIVSTDDPEIADVARKWGGDVPFLRPEELATDASSIIDAVLHAVDRLREPYRYAVLLQATSPLRMSSDIDEALALCRKSHARACVSITPAPKAGWTLGLNQNGRLMPFFESSARRRQDLPAAYMPNGAVYVAEIDWLRKQSTYYAPEAVGYVMPPERSVDVDTMLDFRLAEAVLLDRSS